MTRLTRWMLPVAVALLPALAAAGAALRGDLEGIKKKIEREKQGISEVHQQEGSVLKTLEQIQTELERKNRLLSEANARLKALAADMRRAEAELVRLERSIAERRELLKRRLTALYRWHRGGSPLVVLNGDLSLGALLRRRRYLEATVTFDRQLIDALAQEASRQQALKAELAEKKGTLDHQRRELAEVKESVQQEAARKRELLATLRREKEARTRALKELEAAALRLQKMLDEIARRSAPQPTPGSGLEALRGKLEWPVKGQVVGAYGRTRHREFSEEVFRKGIDIEAPLGEPIRAVEKGTVVFAERFSGYGKMVIVDHGKRFYTIYAHLSEFLKKTGETVDRGEPLGLVGDSDSLEGARLYFEMRKDGKSIDPIPWLTRP
ncbi:MAG TPA: peptidoglycan DD-metalloendopeptidase family protein [Candidatus Eisenbacteria bacterium]|nr:peptidoglycan DD-metalloendopeptidase family protein [Candidatus Eisenbacteria bacterium]